MDIFALIQPIRGGIYISALIVCVLFISLIVRANLPNKRYLIIFLGLKVCIILCEWLMVHVSVPNHYFWLTFMMLLSFGPAPLLLRFAQSIAFNNNGSFSLKVKPWEWSIVGVSLFLLMPLFLASQVMFSFDVSPKFGRFIHLTLSVCILIFVIQVLLYWIKARRIYQLELHNLKQCFSNLKQHSLKILQVLLVLVLSNLLFSLLRTFNVWFWQTNIDITTIANLLEYSMILGCMFVLFHGMLPINTQEPNVTASNKPSNMRSEVQNNIGQKSPKYAKVQLNESFRLSIIDKLQNSSTTAPLARDNAISLNEFAKAIGVRPQYISQVLNQDLATSFYEYITEHRIQYVINHLSEPSQLTIYDMALAAGFNSKSTFNTAFKKRTGLTPSQFRTNKLRSETAQMT